MENFTDYAELEKWRDINLAAATENNTELEYLQQAFQRLESPGKFSLCMDGAKAFATENTSTAQLQEFRAHVMNWFWRPHASCGAWIDFYLTQSADYTDAYYSPADFAIKQGWFGHRFKTEAECAEFIATNLEKLFKNNTGVKPLLEASFDYRNGWMKLYGLVWPESAVDLNLPYNKTNKKMEKFRDLGAGIEIDYTFWDNSANCKWRVKPSELMAKLQKEKEK